MSTQIQRRRGTTAEHSTFTGVEGELTIDTTKDTAVVHDGTTVGGHPLQKQYPALGSASTPTYTFTGDTNTGIYSPGADQVAISTGGSGRLFVDASGRVGVGASPTSLFSVRGNTPAINIDDELNTSSKLVFRPAVLGYAERAGFSLNYSTGEFRQFSGASAAGYFQTFYTDGSERLRITSAGLVGVGTSSPNGKLHVIGDSATPGVGNINISNAAFPTSGWAFRIPDSGATIDLSLDGAVGGVFRSVMYFARATGNVGVGTTTPGGKLTVVTTTDTPGNSFGGFTDSYLAVSTGTSAASSGLGFGYDSTNNHGLILSVSPSVAWRPIRYIAADHRFEITGGIEKARIDTSGRLLVGTSTTSAVCTALLQNRSDNGGPGTLFLSTTTTAPTSAEAFGRIIWTDSGHNAAAQIEGGRDGGTWTSGSSQPSKLVFSTCGDGASSPTPRMTITSTGQVRLAGAGITFNGDTATANELDDYEEGTFTPTVVGNTTAGTATYSTQNGIYRKIGSLVHVSIALSWTSGTGTGSLQVGGLPFNVNTAYLPVFSVFGVNIALTANNVIGGFSNLTAGIQLVQTPVGGGNDTTVLYDAAGGLYITGAYVAA